MDLVGLALHLELNVSSSENSSDVSKYKCIHLLAQKVNMEIF